MVLRIDPGLPTEEEFGEITMVAIRGEAEGGVAGGTDSNIDVCAPSQQQRRDIRESFRRSVRQRSLLTLPIVHASIRVRSTLEQEFHDLDAVRDTGLTQRAVHHLLRIGALSQEEPD